MKRDLEDQLSMLVKGLTPSLQLQFYAKGKLQFEWQYGRKYRYFDLSSLTKILFTSTAFLLLFQENLAQPEDRVQKYLPWFKHSKTTIKDLLTHTSGLSWWLPIYETLQKIPSLEEKLWWLKHAIREQPLHDQKTAVYSDLSFWTLGLILEAIYQRPQLSIWEDTKKTVYPASSSLHFRPLSEPLANRGFYAPTELCPDRKKRLQGEVHDDNSYAMGGVSSHAGLFGSVSDVTQAGVIYLQALAGLNQQLEVETVSRTVRRALPRSRGDWGMGFMLPALKGSSCGTHFSKRSFGHLGFTGCSLWVDPVNEWVMAIVSNRVFYGRGSEFAKIRGPIHDVVVEQFC